MIKNIDDFTLKDKIGSFEDRIKYYNENEYRFKDGMHIFDDIINAGVNNLSQLKLYLITEDTCFDYLKAKYDKQNNVVIVDNKKISVD